MLQLLKSLKKPTKLSNQKSNNKCYPNLKQNFTKFKESFLPHNTNI